MSNLITPTLLDSLDWYMKCPPSWKERAYDGLSNTLNRVWVSNVHVEAGMKLEKQIYEWANRDQEEWEGSKLFTEICNHVKGGNFQAKTKRIIDINGVEYCLYGKLDVLFPELIIDIKTTSDYKGKSNYLSKWQHKFYCYLKNIPEFIYIIAELEDLIKIKKVHYVEYRMENKEKVEEEIIEKVKEFMGFLDMYPELKKAYHEKFCLY